MAATGPAGRAEPQEGEWWSLTTAAPRSSPAPSMKLTGKTKVLTALLGATAALAVTALVLTLVEAISILLPTDTKVRPQGRGGADGRAHRAGGGRGGARRAGAGSMGVPTGQGRG